VNDGGYRQRAAGLPGRRAAGGIERRRRATPLESASPPARASNPPRRA